MKTPLEIALEHLRGERLDPRGPARMTPLGAMRVWAQMFGLTFFGLFACAGVAIATTPLLLAPLLPAEQQAPGVFIGLMLLALLYCLGNILLIQGLRGARWVHNLLLASLLLLALYSTLIRAPGTLLLVSLAACAGGLALSNSKRYRAMLSLHAMIRQLRREHGLQRRRIGR